MKLAYADLYRYNADPRFAKVPVQGLLSKDYAKERAKLIDAIRPTATHRRATADHSDTTYLTAVDREGNIVSLIQSNYAGIWFWSHGAGHGIRPAKSRRPILARPAQTQRARSAQAPLSTPSFQPSWKGGPAHRFRHHGRTEPASGSRAVRLQHCRLQHEHPGSVGAGAFHRQPQARLQYRHRVARARRRARQTSPPRAIS